MKAVLFADGGSRGNPGPAASGAVLFAEDGSTLAEVGEYLGIATNNVAEWSALLAGLAKARELGVDEIAVRMDSELVVRQVTGVYKVKNAALVPLATRAKTLLRGFRSSDIRHVPRDENAHADAVVNQVLDAAAARGCERGSPTEGETGWVVRQSPIPLLIFIASLIGLGGAYVYFQATQTGRYEASRDVLTERSEIRLRMLVRYDTGPLASEEYAMSDIEGTSGATYRLASRAGLQISITERPRVTLEPGMNVAFFFGQVVNDGIWELTSKPPRGDTATHYEIEIAQISGRGHGSRRIVFTDPHYWATTGGHQYHIVLEKNKPVPDLLQMSSTTLVEPRYLKLVADFRAFGPPSLQAKIAAARARAGIRG